MQAVVADGVLEHALGAIARLARDVVDRAGGRVGVEDRGRSATHHFDALGGLVEAERLVAVEIAQRGVVLHRHAVIEQGDRTEAVDRHAARAHVAAGLAAGGLDPEARHALQGFGDAGGRLQAQPLLVDAGDRIAGFGLAAFLHAGAAGDDDRVQLLGAGGRGGASGFLGMDGQQAGGEASAGREDAANRTAEAVETDGHGCFLGEESDRAATGAAP